MATIRARLETGFEAFGRTTFRNRLTPLSLVSSLIAGVLSRLPREPPQFCRFERADILSRL